MLRTVGEIAPHAALHQSGLLDNAYDRAAFRSMQSNTRFLKPKAKPIMPLPNDVAGTAALAICESLLLSLNDHKILPETEILGVLRDAAAAHELSPNPDQAELHAAVATLIHGILANGNSVRRV